MAVVQYMSVVEIDQILGKRKEAILTCCDRTGALKEYKRVYENILAVEKKLDLAKKHLVGKMTTVSHIM